jgi:flavin-dependent dehydrogenase
MADETDRSVGEPSVVRAPGDRYDVAILGGGLAGLTLAIQVKRSRPSTSVVVLEKREGPAPLAAFKVGESTQPVGAHYFADVVGMRDHLEREQLRKFGLRFFLPSNGNASIAERAEIGAPVWSPHDSYQVDRGLFENKLAAQARSLGVDVSPGSRVGEVTVGSHGSEHQIEFAHFGNAATTSARWVVDAAGRASLLKRKLGLGGDSGHHVNAVWFRLAGGLDIEEWGRDDAAWMARISEPGLRQYSTNHLLGEGYWVWMIPLATGPISIGVCTDPRYHPFEDINQFDRLLAWLREHEPQLAASVERRVEDIEDFLRIEDFSYDVQRTYSADRWGLVGEAAAFSDPLFSPGSDFIAYSNTFASDLIVRDLEGEEISDRLDYYNGLYQRAFAVSCSRYRDMYPVLGNSWVGCALLMWSFYADHSGLVLLAVKDKLTDYEFMRSVDAELDCLFRLGTNMYELFRRWNVLERKIRPPAFLGAIPVTISGLQGLVKEFPDDEALREELRIHVRNAEAMAVAMFHRAAAALPEAPPAERPVNPYAVGLDPDAWEADGLFDASGLALEEAKRIVTGIDSTWDDSVDPFEGAELPAAEAR